MADRLSGRLRSLRLQACLSALRAVLPPISLEQGTPGDVTVEKDDARSFHGPDVCPCRSPLPPHEDGRSCGGRRTDVDWTRPGGRASTATASTPLERHGGTTPNKRPNLRRIDIRGRLLESTTVRGEELSSEVERPRPHRKTALRHSSPRDARRRIVWGRSACSLRHGPIMPFVDKGQRRRRGPRETWHSSESLLARAWLFVKPSTIETVASNSGPQSSGEAHCQRPIGDRPV
jgi:hypothetical protein